MNGMIFCDKLRIDVFLCINKIEKQKSGGTTLLIPGKGYTCGKGRNLICVLSYRRNDLVIYYWLIFL
jgi:hypothetical protein